MLWVAMSMFEYLAVAEKAQTVSQRNRLDRDRMEDIVQETATQQVRVLSKVHERVYISKDRDTTTW